MKFKFLILFIIHISIKHVHAKNLTMDEEVRKCATDGLASYCRDLAVSNENLNRFNTANLLYSRACTLGDGYSCFKLFEKTTELKEKLEYLKKSCSLNHPNACIAKYDLLSEKNEVVFKKELGKICSSFGIKDCEYSRLKEVISNVNSIYFAIKDVKNNDKQGFISNLINRTKSLFNTKTSNHIIKNKLLEEINKLTELFKNGDINSFAKSVSLVYESSEDIKKFMFNSNDFMAIEEIKKQLKFMFSNIKFTDYNSELYLTSYPLIDTLENYKDLHKLFYESYSDKTEYESLNCNLFLHSDNQNFEFENFSECIFYQNSKRNTDSFDYKYFNKYCNSFDAIYFNGWHKGEKSPNKAVSYLALFSTLDLKYRLALIQSSQTLRHFETNFMYDTRLLSEKLSEKCNSLNPISSDYNFNKEYKSLNSIDKKIMDRYGDLIEDLFKLYRKDGVPLAIEYDFYHKSSYLQSFPYEYKLLVNDEFNEYFKNEKLNVFIDAIKILLDKKDLRLKIEEKIKKIVDLVSDQESKSILMKYLYLKSYSLASIYWSLNHEINNPFPKTYDCSKAKIQIEEIICMDPIHSYWDYILNKEFNIRDRDKNEVLKQKIWIIERDKSLDPFFSIIKRVSYLRSHYKIESNITYELSNDNNTGFAAAKSLENNIDSLGILLNKCNSEQYFTISTSNTNAELPESIKGKIMNSSYTPLSFEANIKLLDDSQELKTYMFKTNIKYKKLIQFLDESAHDTISIELPSKISEELNLNKIQRYNAKSLKFMLESIKQSTCK